MAWIAFSRVDRAVDKSFALQVGVAVEIGAGPVLHINHRRISGRSK